MKDDAERWNGKFSGRSSGEPAQPQGLEGIDRVRLGGRCLDVACGLGEQSLWAALRGYDVVSLDASDVAIAALNEAAESRGVRDRIDSRVFDLDDGLPTDLECGSCSLVICQRFRDPRLYGPLVGMLQPGGVLVITVLSQVGLGGGDAGRFHAEPGELVCEFRDFDVLEIERSVEADGEATLIARRVARRRSATSA